MQKSKQQYNKRDEKKTKKYQGQKNAHYTKTTTKRQPLGSGLHARLNKFIKLIADVFFFK